MTRGKQEVKFSRHSLFWFANAIPTYSFELHLNKCGKGSVFPCICLRSSRLNMWSFCRYRLLTIISKSLKRSDVPQSVGLCHTSLSQLFILEKVNTKIEGTFSLPHELLHYTLKPMQILLIVSKSS